MKDIISTSITLLLLVCTVLFVSNAITLQADTPAAFYPTWKLLKQEDKVQYLSGYMHAWQDAHLTLGIAADYVNQNPESAADSIRRLQRIYDFSSLRPDTLVREIDAYYADGKQQSSSLSQAITAARSRLR